MIIAIDESGEFSAKSPRRHFFVAIQIRQRRTLYSLKHRQFGEWELRLPKSLKNHKGEIKSSKLSEKQLELFAREVIASTPHILITPFAIRPIDNSEEVINKLKKNTLKNIREAVIGYQLLDKTKTASFYDQLGHWFDKLSYCQYLKVVLLGNCIVAAFINAIGSSVVQGFDDELTRIKYVIDKDFIRGKEHNAFWRELLRNQLYNITKYDPLPILDTWEAQGHPFLKKYEKDGVLDFNDLFWNNCQFGESHLTWEIRLADAVSTIFSIYFNDRKCIRAYKIIEQLIHGKDRRVRQLKFTEPT